MGSLPVKSVGISDAKTQLSRLISDAEAGTEITITRRGVPVAHLVPIRTPGSTRKPGKWRGRVSISSDFDEFTHADTLDWYGQCG